MNKRFILFGMPPGGLFLARQLRRTYPSAEIIAIGDSKKDIGRFSNTLDAFYGVDNDEDLIEKINIVYNKKETERFDAFFCSNPMLEAIVEKYPQVFDYFRFENKYDLYAEIIDKNNLAKLCDQLGINRPAEFDLKQILPSELAFPIVIKPLSKKDAPGVGKCVYIESIYDYLSFSQKLARLGIDESCVLCQQMIEGDNSWEYGYGGYFVGGAPVVDICFHQFIQVPQGLCCYSREITDAVLESNIKELVLPFLKHTRYTGILEFDIKQDSKSKKLYLLDVNPRPWRSSDMLLAKVGKSTIFNPLPIGKKVVWRYPYREMFARKNANNPRYSTCKSLTQGYKTETQIMLLDRRDVKPIIMQIKEDFKDLFKRINR